MQLNSILFAKTLVRKDLASTGSNSSAGDKDGQISEGDAEKKDEDDFSSKAQIMTLMTTDVDRVSDFSWHLFTLVGEFTSQVREKGRRLRQPTDAPVEIVVGTIFLYSLLGVSCLFGLLVTCLFLPLNHFAGKVIVSAQDNLMKARDERVSLMNEILGGIRMLKFMAWERSFESRVHKVRRKELEHQRRNYHIEVGHLLEECSFWVLTFTFRCFSTPFGAPPPFSSPWCLSGTLPSFVVKLSLLQLLSHRWVSHGLKTKLRADKH